MNYTIPAIPTVYGGRQYRSRLEARWAAFFDLCGWDFEYEPCDFGKWSPDFALRGMRPGYPVYVEVKPIEDWDRVVARKMADASESDIPYRRLLLLGCDPFGCYGPEIIGWLGEQCTMGFEFRWDYASIVRSGSLRQFDIQPHADSDMCREGWLRESGPDFEVTNGGPLWTEAANIVQWRSPRNQRDFNGSSTAVESRSP